MDAHINCPLQGSTFAIFVLLLIHVKIRFFCVVMLWKFYSKQSSLTVVWSKDKLFYYYFIIIYILVFRVKAAIRPNKISSAYAPDSDPCNSERDHFIPPLNSRPSYVKTHNNRAANGKPLPSVCKKGGSGGCRKERQSSKGARTTLRRRSVVVLLSICLCSRG